MRSISEKVGGSSPSERATISAGQGPVPKLWQGRETTVAGPAVSQFLAALNDLVNLGERVRCARVADAMALRVRALHEAGLLIGRGKGTAS